MPVASSLREAMPMGAASLNGQPAWWVGKHSFQWPVIARWRKGAWREVLTPWRRDGALTGVSAVTSTAAWAVGYKPGSAPRAISARWNGSSWAAVAVPHPGGRMSSLADVVAVSSDRAWAVGERLFRGRLEPLAMRYSPGGWTNVSPPIASPREGGLTAVTRAPDGKIWTVGWRTKNERQRPWIAYRDASGWQETPSATLAGGAAILTDVTFRSASEGWAVGYRERETGGGYAPILERWDGASWQSQATPWDADASVALTTVAVNSNGALALGGNRIGNMGPSAVLAGQSGGSWLVTGDPLSLGARSWIFDASTVGSNGSFAVGRGEFAQAFIRCPGGTVTTPSQTAVAAPVASAAQPAEDDYDQTVIDLSAPGSTQTLSATALNGFTARDVTLSAGLAMQVSTYSGVTADFNSDGWPDLYINRHVDDVPRLMMGGPDGFVHSGASFVFADRHGCAVGEVNGDNHPDLFCTVGRGRGTVMSTHELLLGVESTGGTQAATEYGVNDASGRGRVATFVHLEQDPFDSLFVVNVPIRVDGLSSMNRFYRNVDGTHFTAAAEYGLDRSMGGACVAAANLDADADDEILLCVTEPSPGSLKGLRLFDFDGTAFVDRTSEWGILPMADSDVEVADFDGDGSMDIAQLRGSRLRVSLARPAGFKNVYELATTKAAAMAVGDVNDDQRPDIYISRSAYHNSQHLMLINDGFGRSFASVQIPQASSGSTDEVLTLDYDQNGLADFVTLNGRYSPGPVKLIAFFRTGE